MPDGSNVLTNEQLDAYVVNPSLSQDQLFSILDVSPSCAYIGTNTKVCKLFCALNCVYSYSIYVFHLHRPQFDNSCLLVSSL